MSDFEFELKAKINLLTEQLEIAERERDRALTDLMAFRRVVVQELTGYITRVEALERIAKKASKVRKQMTALLLAVERTLPVRKGEAAQ